MISEALNIKPIVSIGNVEFLFSCFKIQSIRCTQLAKLLTISSQGPEYIEEKWDFMLLVLNTYYLKHGKTRPISPTGTNKS